MAYVKNTWVDRVGQVRYAITEDEDNLSILTPNYEEVTEIGTPVNALNMNHIEQGIYDCYSEIDTKINAMLQTLYPVGSIYIGTQSTCPLESLFGTWTLVAADRVLQGSSSNHSAGATIAAGLPNIKGEFTAANYVHWNGGSFGGTATESTTNGGQQGSHNIGDGGSGCSFRKIKLNASNSSTIYSDSVATVQPPAYVVNIWRRTA